MLISASIATELLKSIRQRIIKTLQMPWRWILMVWPWQSKKLDFLSNLLKRPIRHLEHLINIVWVGWVGRVLNHLNVGWDTNELNKSYNFFVKKIQTLDYKHMLSIYSRWPHSFYSLRTTQGKCWHLPLTPAFLWRGKCNTSFVF